MGRFSCWTWYNLNMHTVLILPNLCQNVSKGMQLLMKILLKKMGENLTGRLHPPPSYARGLAMYIIQLNMRCCFKFLVNISFLSICFQISGLKFNVKIF